MARSRRGLFLFSLLLALSLCASVLLAKDSKEKKNKKALKVAQMDDREKAIHVLNRLTFGPRPGDIERVQAMGVNKWLDQQLHPEKIDDSALESRLAGLRTLKMDTRQMVEEFPPPQLIKAVADGAEPMPSDPVRRAVYQAELDRYRERQENKAAQTLAADQANGASQKNDGQMMPDPVAQRQDRMWAQSKAASLLELPPGQRFREILNMNPSDRRVLAQSLPQDQRQQLLDEMKPEEREALIAMVNPQMVVTGELLQGKILRAAYSERQLEEVMTDFWYNHFNVFIGKGADRYMITSYERDVIRPHALGKFKDLLEATAKSPAMLFYLDNWQSVGPNSTLALYGNRQPPNRPAAVAPRPRIGLGPFGMPRIGIGGPVYRPQRPQPAPGAQRPPNQKASAGLNENYARELMELHTLGVDGGYTQHDVTEVARVFTGWTLREPRQGGEFQFIERRHEPGSKMVLGHEIKEHGQSEGEEVLNLLAHHPSTAHFICTKLAQRFVSDTPPEALVDRMAKTFQDKDGDIREVLRTMLSSPEFWQPDEFRAKVKTPLEFVVSAVRASGAEITNARPLLEALNRMGMPLYGAQPPTGYPMKAENWVNSAALLNRMNLALALASDRLPGTRVDPQGVLVTEATAELPPRQAKGGKQAGAKPVAGPPPDGDAALALLEQALLAGDVSRQTHDTIRKQMLDPQLNPNGPKAGSFAAQQPNLGVIAGLILGSPEFQRR